MFRAITSLVGAAVISSAVCAQATANSGESTNRTNTIIEMAYKNFGLAPYSTDTAAALPRMTVAAAVPDAEALLGKRIIVIGNFVRLCVNLKFNPSERTVVDRDQKGVFFDYPNTNYVEGIFESNSVFIHKFSKCNSPIHAAFTGFFLPVIIHSGVSFTKIMFALEDIGPAD